MHVHRPETQICSFAVYFTQTHTHKDIFVYKPRSSIILANVTWLNCLWIHMMLIYRFSSARLLYSPLISFPSLYRSFSFVYPFLWHHCFLINADWVWLMCCVVRVSIPLLVCGVRVCVHVCKFITWVNTLHCNSTCTCNMVAFV